jgi:hypothetical protein
MDTLLDRISSRHTKPETRDSKLLIPETDIDLWATCGVRLSSGSYWALWRYEARDGQSDRLLRPRSGATRRGLSVRSKHR